MKKKKALIDQYSFGSEINALALVAEVERAVLAKAWEQESTLVSPDIFKKVIFEQPDETKELVIGVDDNDCPYFIIGAQKFRLDPTVIESRDHAKWYQKQLSIAFDRFTDGAQIHPLPAQAIPPHVGVGQVCNSDYASGWNDCVDIMLSASPKP